MLVGRGDGWIIKGATLESMLVGYVGQFALFTGSLQNDHEVSNLGAFTLEHLVDNGF